MRMVGLISAMFWAPEAQPDSYTWAAVLLAHAALGAALVAGAACLPPLRRRPVLAVALAYGMIWEGGQWLLAGGGLADGVVDWVAVTLGAVAGRAAWDRRGRRMGAALAVLAAVMWAGVRRRR